MRSYLKWLSTRELVTTSLTNGRHRSTNLKNLLEAGQHFVCAGNKRIPNQGQVTLGLKGLNEAKAIKSTFQVADVTRPLWSVGRICDEGFKITFDDKKAEVLDKKGRVVCTFDRQGGLYLSKLRLKTPNFRKSFRGPGPNP